MPRLATQTEPTELPLQTRTVGVRAADLEPAERTISLAFSSEERVEQPWGFEILDHSPGAADLARIADRGPVLVNHDIHDHVGVVESVEIGTDRVGRAVVRLGNSARATEILDDVRNGIRPHVSVRYRIVDMVREHLGDDVETWRVLRWEPLEISFASIPADHRGAGVGRSADPDRLYPVTVQKNQNMPDPITPPAEPPPPTPPATPAPVPTAVLEQDRERARAAEQGRVRDIYALGDHHNQRDLAAEAVKEGWTFSRFSSELLKKVGRPVPAGAANLGMTEPEVRRYSFVNVIRYLADKSNPAAREAAAYELEMSDAANDALGKTSQGLRVPNDVMERGEIDLAAGAEVARRLGRRDLTVGTTTAGGFLKATDLLSGSFIDVLRNRTVLFGRSTILPGLVGDVAIPRHDTASTAYWVTEGTAITESAQVFGQVAMAPSTLGGLVEISRKLLKQSSVAIEAFVRMDIARVLGVELDRVGIEGSGSGAEPTGIINTSGIGAVALGASGAAPTWASIVKLEEEVAVDNADLGDLFYLGNAKVRSVLKRTLRTPTYGDAMLWDTERNTLNGYPALVSNNVPWDLTKSAGSNLSALLFGNAADCLYGLWGGMDLTLDPYTNSATGALRIVALQEADFALRHVQSWAAIVDMVTT